MQQVKGGLVEFRATRLRPIKRVGAYRRDGAISWNEGGFRVDGSHLYPQGTRLLIILPGLFVLGLLGVIIAFVLTEKVILKNEGIPVAWWQIRAFGILPEKRLVAVDFEAAQQFTPVVFRSHFSDEFVAALRAAVPDREVQVTGAGQVPTWVGFLIISGIFVAVFVLVALFWN